MSLEEARLVLWVTRNQCRFVDLLLSLPLDGHCDQSLLSQSGTETLKVDGNVTMCQFQMMPVARSCQGKKEMHWVVGEESERRIRVVQERSVEIGSQIARVKRKWELVARSQRRHHAGLCGLFRIEDGERVLEVF